MKKMIPFIIVLLGLAAVAAPEPCPFLFKVQTSPPDITGLTLTMSYKDQTWTSLEQVPGEYSFALGSEGIPNCNYQNFDLVIKECEGDSVCHRTVSFNNQGITWLDIRDASLFITTTTPATTTTSPVTTMPECFTYAECAELVDCMSICEDIFECPEDELTIQDAFVYVISMVIGGFAVYVYQGKIKLSKKSIDKLIEVFPKGCGLRLFRSYIGESNLKHIHRSPKRYHALDSRHREKYDHEGEKNLFPDFKEG